MVTAEYPNRCTSKVWPALAQRPTGKRLSDLFEGRFSYLL